MDPTLPAIVGGIVAVLAALYFWLKRSADRERSQNPPPDIELPSKQECKRLVLAALEARESLVSANEPLAIDEDCREIWAALPEELTSFLSQHGKISWGSGHVGGQISRVTKDKALTKFLRRRNYDTSGLVIGADEAERLFVMPGQEKIFSAMEFFDRVDSFENVFELIVSAADLSDG